MKLLLCVTCSNENIKRVSEKGTLHFLCKSPNFPKLDFLICSKVFVLEYVNR